MILVVDDSAFNLEIQSDLIKSFLSQHDELQYASQIIDTANDGQVAVELIKRCL